MNTTAVAAAVAGIDGVVSVNEWTRVAGRERVYFKLARYNGVSHELTAGVGVEGHVDAAGDVYLSSGGHNASVYYHRENGTISAIKRAGKLALEPVAAMDRTPEEEAEAISY